MYEHHAAIEDTLVFPAWKQAVSAKEYHELSERFEELECKMFGKDGFERFTASSRPNPCPNHRPRRSRRTTRATLRLAFKAEAAAVRVCVLHDIENRYHRWPSPRNLHP
jgi:hypothetical protein